VRAAKDWTEEQVMQSATGTAAEPTGGLTSNAP
jgi:hypothetical protein